MRRNALCVFCLLLMVCCGVQNAYSVDRILRLHIEWNFDYQPIEGRTHIGFNLYEEGVHVWSFNDPAWRGGDMYFPTAANVGDTPDYVLTAYFSDGSESPNSAPFPFLITSVEEGIYLGVPVVVGITQN